MDHFQRSMAIRAQIIGEKPLLKKLAAHFFEARKLDDVLGHGTNNIHYRAGMLPSGLWVATREQFEEPIRSGDPDRADPLRARFRQTGNWKTLEFGIYCREAYCWSEFGGFGRNRSVSEFVENGGEGYATAFSILVRYKPLWRRSPMYAMLVEDLSAGGQYRLETPGDEDWVARIDGRGAPVQIDLDDFPRWRKNYPSVPDYTSEQAMLDLGAIGP
ncbi:MAG: hypothetical protein AB1529_01785 [Candidatus Micrarchaeota archaeon]